MAIIYRRMPVAGSSPSRRRKTHRLAWYLQTMKNTSWGVWGAAMSAPKKSPPTFGRPRGFGGRVVPHPKGGNKVLFLISSREYPRAPLGTKTVTQVAVIRAPMEAGKHWATAPMGNRWNRGTATQGGSRKKTRRRRHRCADRRESPIGRALWRGGETAAGPRQGEPTEQAPPSIDGGQPSGRKSSHGRMPKALRRTTMGYAPTQGNEQIKNALKLNQRTLSAGKAVARLPQAGGARNPPAEDSRLRWITDGDGLPERGAGRGLRRARAGAQPIMY